ncbi:MAG: hypothetical protein RLY40_497 [Pseudomonadota bacterium]
MMYKRKLSSSFKKDNYNKARRLVAWAKQFSRKNWYVPKKLTEDGFFSSFGPRSGIIFVGDDNTDDITEEKGILSKLNVIFNEGINYDNCLLSAAEFIPYFTSKYKYLIQGDVTKKQALQLTDEYSFVYVIDASRESDLISFPASPCNTNNPKFFKGASFDPGTDYQYFFIVPFSIKPQSIIGAFAIGALAHSLTISEETLIINPNCKGNIQEIKDKLKINDIKEFKDCQVTASDYESAVEAYDQYLKQLYEESNSNRSLVLGKR